MTVGVVAMVLSGYNLEMSIGAAISALVILAPRSVSLAQLETGLVA